MKRTFISLAAISAIFIPSVAFAKPIISSVTPITATVGTPVAFSATVNSNTPIQRCTLWVDLAEIGEMTVKDGIATRAYTFSEGGSRIAFVFCRDTNSSMDAGANTAITVSGEIKNTAPLNAPNAPAESKPLSVDPIPAPPKALVPTVTPTSTSTQNQAPTQTANQAPNQTPTPAPAVTSPNQTQTATPSAYIGKLLKESCKEDATNDSTCHAVYYIGKDGKRHAFPNSHVFFTWYSNFNSVQEVSGSTLYNHQLGMNVLYRAGSKMVKFTTDPKVYAVSKGGALRWIKTEELAHTYYGNDWNKKIDDISDSFFANYTIGTEINTTSDYSPATELGNSKE